MRDFDLRTLQLKELDILKEVDRVCKKNKIEYFLAYGTTLGAVRHHGFIPWDDDIDICMKPNDYLKFKEACKKDLNEKYFYQDFHTDPYVHTTWAKIRENGTTSMVSKMKNYPVHWGICIDIFPLWPLKDKHLSGKEKLLFKLLNLCANKKLDEAGFGNYGVQTNKAKFIPGFLTHWLYTKIEKYLLKRKEANYYFDLSGGIVEKYLMAKDIYEEIILLDFEGEKFPVMKRYDEYLTRCYGSDYMEIPKVEEREDHGDIIVDFEKDYKEYIK